MPDKQDKLKPCPLCKSDDVDWTQRAFDEITIHCYGCNLKLTGARIHLTFDQLKEALFKRWNTRPEEAADKGRVVNVCACGQIYGIELQNCSACGRAFLDGAGTQEYEHEAMAKLKGGGG